MIRPISLIKLLNYLIGQQYNIEYVNLAPAYMKACVVFFRKVKSFEVKFFDTYVVIYLQSKAIKVFSEGWITRVGQEIYVDSKTKTVYRDTIIKYTKDEHRSI